MERSELEDFLHLAGCKIMPSGDVVREYEGRWHRVLYIYRDHVYTYTRESKSHFKHITSITLSEGESDITKVFFDDKGDWTIPMERYTMPSLAMPKSDSALADAFLQIYPDYKDRMYYDEMTECEMVDASLFDNTAPDGTYKLFDDTLEYLYYSDIEHRLTALGCTGTFPSPQIKYRTLLTKIKETSRNFFKEWVLSKPWDGKSRVDGWFKNVFGGSAPPLKENKLEEAYLAKVARAWFVGGIKRMFKATQSDIIPVLISAKQGMGKTTGLEYTAGDPTWYAASTIDVTKNSGAKEFLDMARGKSVIELAEGTTLRTNDQDTLKAFISKPSDQYRKPYAKREGLYPRHFILASTSNEEELLSDPTGNRRYFPIYIFKMPDFDYRTPENVQQVWAEAYEMYKIGEEHFIDANWKPAIMMQAYAQKADAAVERINRWLDDPANGYTAVGARVCEAEIMEKMFYYDKAHITIDTRHSLIWKAWTKGHGDAWAKFPTPYKYDNISVRGYIREQAPLAMFEEYEERMTEEQRIQYIREARMTRPQAPTPLADCTEDSSFKEQFITFCREHDLKDEWQIVPVDGEMTYEQFTMWMNMGYITKDPEDGKFHLTVAVR